MTTRIVLISDTHVPKRARELPDAVWQAVDAADVVMHAGDWVDLPTFERMRERARHLIAVWGNNDGPDLRVQMPEIAYEQIEGVRFAITHETGASIGREKRCDDAFPDTDVLVFGHSHIPWDTVTPRGLRLLNPGSPTDRRREPFCTYLSATAADGLLTEVELHRL